MKKLSEYFILYCDVLGYCNQLEKDEVAFLQIIESLMDEVRSKSWKIEVKTFSDNILICYKVEDNNSPKFICHFASRLQEKMMRRYAILLRGVITKGKLYLDDNFVYGSGLVRAVKLEEREAKYSRIIIDKNLNNCKYIANSQYTIINDEIDNVKFINFMNYYHPIINKRNTRTKNFEELLKSYNKAIDNFNNDIKKIGFMKFKKKMLLQHKRKWLINYFSKIREQYNI